MFKGSVGHDPRTPPLPSTLATHVTMSSRIVNHPTSSTPLGREWPAFLTALSCGLAGAGPDVTPLAISVQRITGRDGRGIGPVPAATMPVSRFMHHLQCNLVGPLPIGPPRSRNSGYPNGRCVLHVHGSLDRPPPRPPSVGYPRQYYCPHTTRATSKAGNDFLRARWLPTLCRKQKVRFHGPCVRWWAILGPAVGWGDSPDNR